MKIVYIAHPVSGDVKNNIDKITKIVREINLTDSKTTPFAPYLADIMALDDAQIMERNRGMKNNKSILKSGLVDEIHLYGNRITNGMLKEVNIALKNGIPIIPKTPETRKGLIIIIDQSNHEFSLSKA